MSPFAVKRVYDPPARQDGARVLVDRLWPRGLTRKKAALTLWLRDAAPSDELRRWVHADASRWEEFCQCYADELDRKPETVAQLMELGRTGRVSLLYAARDPSHNNAVALAAYLARQET